MFLIKIKHLTILLIRMKRKRNNAKINRLYESNIPTKKKHSISFY